MLFSIDSGLVGVASAPNDYRAEKTAQNSSGIPQDRQIIYRSSTLISDCEKIFLAAKGYA